MKARVSFRIAVVLAAIAAPVHAQLVLDEETVSVFHCGSGILQMSCVSANVTFRTSCLGQEFCLTPPAFQSGVRVTGHITFVGATDLPLGGNASMSVFDVNEDPRLRLAAGSCQWPLLGIPQACQLDADFVVDEGVSFPHGLLTYPIRTEGAASSLLSGVSFSDLREVRVCTCRSCPTDNFPQCRPYGRIDIVDR